MPPARVVTENIFKKEIAKTTPIVGIVDFNRIASVSSEVSGLIVEHYFEEGDSIKKGDPLVKFDTDFIKKDIEIAAKRVEEIEVKIEEAQKNVARLEKLYKNAATSEKAFDEQYFLHQSLIKEKEKLLKDIERYKLSLDKSTVKAPFSGIVLARYKELGEWVSIDSAIAEIASIDDVIVRVAISEDLIPYVSVGDSVLINIDPLDKQFEGEIDSFVPVADLKSKTFWLKISIPYFEKAIQNMSVTAHIPTSHKMNILMVKRDALVNFNGQDFVYTIADGKAAIVPVQVVVYNGEYIGIESPAASAGMPVVIDGNERLQPDQPVSVVEGN